MSYFGGKQGDVLVKNVILFFVFGSFLGPILGPSRIL